MNRGLLWNLWRLKNTNRVKNTEERVTRKEKPVLVKKIKMFTNERKRVCHNNPESKRQSTDYKDANTPVKKKILGAAISKKTMLTVLWDMKGPITIDFLEKEATVMSASYFQLLKLYFTIFIKWRLSLSQPFSTKNELEGGNWGSTASRETVNKSYFYQKNIYTKLTWMYLSGYIRTLYRGHGHLQGHVFPGGLEMRICVIIMSSKARI